MSQVNSLQTLDLILEDISAEINLSISSLDRFRKEPKTQKSLKKCLAHLNRLKGIFTLLEMPGAKRLILDSIKVVKALPKSKQETRQSLLEAVSIGLIRLSRYCEHVNQKESPLPQLLLPSINELRGALNLQLLDESVFFECDCNKPRDNKLLTLLISEESAAKSRHYRQMYQIGLIEVLRQTNLRGGLKMMQKAMAKLDDECPRPTSPNLWWIAQGMLEGYIQQGITLTRSRLKLFSRLDRQIRNLENKPVNRLDDSKSETQGLALEMLYLAWISEVKTQPVAQLMSHFELLESPISDKRIVEEQQELRGPSAKDYSSMIEALIEEVDKIDKTLTQACEKELAILELKQVMKQMINLNNLLKILQVDDQIIRLSVAVDLIDKAIAKKQPISQKDTNILFLVLKSIKEAIDEPKLAKYSGISRKQRSRISETQMKVCEKTDGLVKELIKDISLFAAKDRKLQYLENAESLILQIKQGFKKLKVTKAEAIFDACISFVNNQLLTAPEAVSDTSIELLADIIGSFEFYLETLKFTSEPSSRILEFAENSLLQLQNHK